MMDMVIMTLVPAIRISLRKTDLDSTDADAWCISKIVYPSGGSESYEYINDRIGVDFISMNIFYDKPLPSDHMPILPEATPLFIHNPTKGVDIRGAFVLKK